MQTLISVHSQEKLHKRTKRLQFVRFDFQSSQIWNGNVTIKAKIITIYGNPKFGPCKSWSMLKFQHMLPHLNECLQRKVPLKHVPDTASLCSYCQTKHMKSSPNPLHFIEKETEWSVMEHFSHSKNFHVVFILLRNLMYPVFVLLQN